MERNESTMYLDTDIYIDVDNNNRNLKDKKESNMSLTK